MKPPPPADSSRAHPRDPIPTETLLRDASSDERSPFDYIIVGSGAGGGPLACRLALAGRRVLLLEAGEDPAKPRSAQFPQAAPGEVNQVPGYHAAATEDLEMSWQFSVRHFASTETQKKDDKYNQLNRVVDDGRNPALPYPANVRFLDPGSASGVGHGGIFYPRSANIGGCTAHHAMIVVAPNDADWDKIAEITGDDSWRAANMRGYFARLERCLYRDDYDSFLQRLLGVVYRSWRWLVLQFDPRAVLDDGGHGRSGWQPTSFIDPALVERIAKEDKGFIEVLARTALGVIHADRPLVRTLKRALFKLRIVQQLDPNDINTRRVSPEGVFLIPTGIQSPQTKGDADPARAGHRVGVREFILDTQKARPEHLVIATGVHVTRVLFADEAGGTPRAIGVEFARGDHLYEASPIQGKAVPKERHRYFVRPRTGEVILSGGAFNTPQLLMLSGIGDRGALANLAADPGYIEPAGDQEGCVLRGRDSKPLRDAHGGTRRIALPGVGQNLQDRYEVSVVSEIDHEFATLKGVSFSPGDPNDPARQQWLENGGGLYRTNGGTLAILKRSRVRGPNEPEPDTFTFGVPAAFRGYYWGWSRELFRPTRGAEFEQRNLWSWVILKAYTENYAGSVALRTGNPFHTPNICFDSFNERAEALDAALAQQIAERKAAGLPTAELEQQKLDNAVHVQRGRRDREALVDAIKSIRAINARNPEQFVREIQPGPGLPDDSAALDEWVKTQAWGHHCSCTCRMGSDTWQADPSRLKDRGAVLDSRFQVHGVKGLRVVDASVFPVIPGYFILAPLLMVSEKAADTLLKERPESTYYPPVLEAREAASIRHRRRIAEVPVPAGPSDQLPANTVALALSGGGIRSATFALGLLQALAAKNRLREVDFLSSVSGGGFTATFLGRLFTRKTVTESSDPAGRVQDVLSNTSSGPLWWLRCNANYIFATGGADVRYNLAVFWRNIILVHLVVGALLFGGFSAFAWLPTVVPLPALPTFGGLMLSVWTWLPLLVFGLAVVPLTLGYWLAPRPGSYRTVPPFSLLAWVVLLLGATAALLVPNGTGVAVGGIAVLGLTWIAQELARLGADMPDAKEATGQNVGIVVRNRLTRAVGEALTLAGVLAAWAILDTAAIAIAGRGFSKGLAAIMAAVAPALPLLRWIGIRAQQKVSADLENGAYVVAAKMIGVPLAVFLLFVVDVLAHELVLASPGWGWGLLLIGTALAFSLVLGRAFDFLNLSSLHATYAARLTRTFLGASNERRVYGSTADDARDVGLAHPEDDVPFDQYHPERSGGPLHLINVCVNETVDLASNREVRERKGLSMCVTPHGVGVGRSYFATWAPPDEWPAWQKRRRWFEGMDEDDRLEVARRRKIALKALPTTSNPHAFHVLASKTSESAEVEPLSVGTWMAISGAAYTTGQGRSTSVALSLFLGLANVRLGYWWDSGIRESERPGRFPPSIWQRVKRLPVSVFRMQSQLLAEWRGRFHGASRWFWYLSDGGHFEVTAGYELLRRRVPFIILSDAGEDQRYEWGDVAGLIRQARTDFGAQVTWIDPSDLSSVPSWVREWINPAALARFEQLGRKSDRHAALARVKYDGAPDRESWLLLVKPGVSTDLPEDIQSYALQNPEFPQDPTLDQVFDDEQWESYRKLGQSIGTTLLAPPTPK